MNRAFLTIVFTVLSFGWASCHAQQNELLTDPKTIKAYAFLLGQDYGNAVLCWTDKAKRVSPAQRESAKNEALSWASKTSWKLVSLQINDIDLKKSLLGIDPTSQKVGYNVATDLLKKAHDEIQSKYGAAAAAAFDLGQSISQTVFFAHNAEQRNSIAGDFRVELTRKYPDISDTLRSSLEIVNFDDRTLKSKVPPVSDSSDPKKLKRQLNDLKKNIDKQLDIEH